MKSCGPGNTLSSQTFVATAIREIEDDEEDGDGKSDYSSTDSVPDAYQPTVLISERDSTWVEHTGFVSNRGYNKKQLKYVVSPHLDALSKPKDKYKNPKRLPYNHQDYRHLRAKSNSRTIGNEGARNSDSVHATRRGTSAHTRTLPSYRRGSAKRRGQRGGSALALASGMRGKASRPSSSPVYLRSLAQSRSMTASRLHHTPSQQRQQQQQQQEQEPATGDDVSLAEYQQSVRQLLADKQALATRTAIKERGAVSDARHAYLNTWKGQSEEKYSVRRKSLAEKEAFHEEQQARAQAGGAENVPCDSNNPDAQNTVQTRTTTKEKKKSKSSSKSEIEYRVSAWELNEELTCMDQLDAFEKQLSLSQKEGQTRRAKYTLEHGKLRHQVRTLGGNEAVRVLRKDLKSDNRDTTLWRQPRMYDY